MGSIIFVPIFFIFSFIAYNLYQRFKYKLPPGPAPWPVVGNIYDVKPVRFRCFYEWAQTYGPIISFKLGPELNIVVSNAELAKQVLKEHDQNLADRYRRPLGKFTKDGKDLIWADYGPHYVKVRKVSTLALFTPKKVDALRPIREDEATAMIESLFNHCNDSENKGKPLNIRKHTAIMSFNNITRLTFGKRFINSKGELDPLGKELMEILTNRKAKANTHANFLAEHLPWFQQLMSIFDSNDKDETTMLNARLDQFIKEIIDEHAEAKLKNNVGGVTVNKQHFVDALLTLKDEYDLGEDTLFGLLWDMIIAGVDTVAISVEWGLAELIRNPRVQKKAQKELDQIIGNRIMTEDDFSNLPYLKALAKETLRLHPPTPLMLPHKAKAHVKISGYDIPKGATVRVNVWALGRDSNVWGNDVNEFRPERFFEEDVDMKGHDFRLLPFGAGRRICPGAQIGINLVTSMLGHLLHHFEWNPPNEVKVDDIDMTESPGIVTYMKTPLQANIIPRLPTDLYKRIPFDM